jgi:DNA invertase Pin-like site-specific DNA recombinase
VGIYARVSTGSQTVENQLRELREIAERHGWIVAAELKDAGISGAKGREQRPGLNRLMHAVTRREIDMVAAWSVDRLGRSPQDLLGFLGELHAKGAALYLHQQGLDTSTPAGKALFQMMGVFAEFERAMIRERVRAGLQRARAPSSTTWKESPWPMSGQVGPNISPSETAALFTGFSIWWPRRSIGGNESLARCARLCRS